MGTGNCGILWLLAGSLFTICCQLRRKSKTRLCWNCLWPQRIESIEGLTFFLPPKHWLRPIQLTHYSITFFCFSLQLFHIFPRVFLMSPFNYGSQIIFEFFHHTAEINVDCNFPPSTGSAPSLQPNSEQDGKGFEPFLVFSCVFFPFFYIFPLIFFLPLGLFISPGSKSFQSPGLGVGVSWWSSGPGPVLVAAVVVT